MHYSDERQEHNEKDWPDNEEWMEAVFQNSPTGCHYPEANHQILTVSESKDVG